MQDDSLRHRQHANPGESATKNGRPHNERDARSEASDENAHVGPQGTSGQPTSSPPLLVAIGNAVWNGVCSLFGFLSAIPLLSLLKGILALSVLSIAVYFVYSICTFGFVGAAVSSIQSVVSVFTASPKHEHGQYLNNFLGTMELLSQDYVGMSLKKVKEHTDRAMVVVDTQISMVQKGTSLSEDKFHMIDKAKELSRLMIAATTSSHDVVVDTRGLYQDFLADLDSIVSLFLDGNIDETKKILDKMETSIAKVIRSVLRMQSEYDRTYRLAVDLKDLSVTAMADLSRSAEESKGEHVAPYSTALLTSAAIGAITFAGVVSAPIALPVIAVKAGAAAFSLAYLQHAVDKRWLADAKVKAMLAEADLLHALGLQLTTVVEGVIRFNETLTHLRHEIKDSEKRAAEMKASVVQQQQRAMFEGRVTAAKKSFGRVRDELDAVLQDWFSDTPSDSSRKRLE